MARSELTFDGKGINGPDEYRSRVAAFANAAAAEEYGALFAAAPELLSALTALAEYADSALSEISDQDTGWFYQLSAAAGKARAVIAKATP